MFFSHCNYLVSENTEAILRTYYLNEENVEKNTKQQSCIWGIIAFNI